MLFGGKSNGGIMPLRLGKIAIIGAGGGFTGAYSAGMLKAFDEKGIKPDYVQAVSVNALNLAEVVSAGSVAGMLKTWAYIESQGQNILFDRSEIKWRVIKRNSFFSERGLRELIWGKKSADGKCIVKGLDVQGLVSSNIVFEFPMHDETHGFEYTMIRANEKQYRENPELLRPPIQAAASMAGFLPPVKCGEAWCSDGLYYDLERAIAAGCDTIFILSNDQLPIEDPEKRNSYHRVFYSFDEAHDQVLELRMQLALLHHKDFKVFQSETSIPLLKRFFHFAASMAASLERGDEINLAPHRIIPIAPKKRIYGLSTVGFEKGNITEAINHGYECAMAILSSLES